MAEEVQSVQPGLLCVVPNCRRIRLPSGVVTHPPVCLTHYEQVPPEQMAAINRTEQDLLRLWNITVPGLT